MTSSNGGPAASATFSSLLTELEVLQHEVAVLEHFAERVFADFGDESGPPPFLVQVGSRSAVAADAGALVEIQSLLATAATTVRARVIEILNMQVAGVQSKPDVRGDQIDVVARVVADNGFHRTRGRHA